jgi:hypothetical protein
VKAPNGKLVLGISWVRNLAAGFNGCDTGGELPF